MDWNSLCEPFRETEPGKKRQQIVFWRNFLVQLCKRNKTGIFSPEEVKALCKQNGKTPHCFDDVITELVKEGSIRELTATEQMDEEAGRNWLGSMISGIKWLVGSKDRSQGLDKTKIYILVQNVEAIASSILEKRNEQIEENYYLQEDLYQQFKDICEDKETFSVSIKWLHDRKKIAIIKLNDGMKVIQFESGSNALVPATQAEITIARLKAESNVLERNIDEQKKLLAKYNSLLAEASKKKDKLEMAKYLKKRNLLQASITTKANNLDKVLSVTHTIETALESKKVNAFLQKTSSALKLQVLGDTQQSEARPTGSTTDVSCQPQ